MKSRINLLIALLTYSTFAYSQSDKKPKLLIGIIVDQMKQEYLYRFQDNYSENGFKRIMRDGFNVKNAHYNYIPTATGPGHSSVFSGTSPGFHGVVGNNWYDRKSESKVYCAEDISADFVGMKGRVKHENIKDGRSPKNLLTNNFADEVKLFSTFKSKVVGISLKDRGAIFPSGHLADYAFWYNSNTGDFITSSYYKDKLPNWLVNFNKSKKADSLLNLVWNTYLPISKYTNSLADDSKYEKILKGKDKPTFPYNLKELRDKNGDFGLITQVPQGNTLITQLAFATISGEKLGQGNTFDYLTLSYSSTDYVGHAFAIRSKELEDTYVRLDREMASLLDFLDKKIGKDNYTLFLTADHAASDNSTFLMDNRLPGGLFDPNDIKEKLNNLLSENFGKGDYISYIDKTQIYLDKKYKFNQKVLKTIDLFLKEDITGLKNHYMPNLNNTQALNYHILRFFENSYNPLSSGDVIFNFLPGWLPGGGKGTSHGNSHNSNTHVPLLWYGNSISKGHTSKYYEITQIVPTLSFLFNIPLPDSSDKNPILEITENKK